MALVGGLCVPLLTCFYSENASRHSQLLTLKGQITKTADNIHKYFSKKIRLDVSSESSARQDSHEKIKPYFLRKVNY